MIDRTLPPLRWDATRAHELALEIFSLAYLASYNLSAIGGRPNTSFRRAWALDSLGAEQRTSTTPAWVVGSSFPTGGPEVITVAIEGAQSVSQVLRFGGAGYQQPAPLAGHVKTYANVAADDIVAKLQASHGVSLNFLPRTTKFVFGGFSLGAAIAEVACAKLRRLAPHNAFKLYKFASPRVGTADWVNADQHTRDRMNYYLRNDPVGSVPSFNQNNIPGVWQDVWAPVCAFIAPNNPITRLDTQGESFVGSEFLQSSFSAYNHSIGSFTNPANPWEAHREDEYRFMLCNLASQRIDHLFYRFIFLEFPDDNQWGRGWNNMVRDQSLLKVLGANPADQPVDLPREEEVVLRDTGGASNGGGWFPGGGGGDDDEPVRQIIRVNPGLQTTPRTRRRPGGS